MRLRALGVLALLVMVDVFGGGILLAQGPESQNAAQVSFSNIIYLVNETSTVYFNAFADRQNNGLLYLTRDETDQLRDKLQEIIVTLKQVPGATKLPALDLTGANQDALSAALTCQNCSGRMTTEAKRKSVDTWDDLQSLLTARCQAIQGLLPKALNSTPSRDTLLSLEVHFAYLRQIAIAYALAG